MKLHSRRAPAARADDPICGMCRGSAPVGADGRCALGHRTPSAALTAAESSPVEPVTAWSQAPVSDAVGPDLSALPEEPDATPTAADHLDQLSHLESFLGASLGSSAQRVPDLSPDLSSGLSPELSPGLSPGLSPELSYGAAPLHTGPAADPHYHPYDEVLSWEAAADGPERGYSDEPLGWFDELDRLGVDGAPAGGHGRATSVAQDHGSAQPDVDAAEAAWEAMLAAEQAEAVEDAKVAVRNRVAMFMGGTIFGALTAGAAALALTS